MRKNNNLYLKNNKNNLKNNKNNNNLYLGNKEFVSPE